MIFIGATVGFSKFNFGRAITLNISTLYVPIWQENIFICSFCMNFSDDASRFLKLKFASSSVATGKDYKELLQASAGVFAQEMQDTSNMLYATFSTAS